jgi:hypothetical protein
MSLALLDCPYVIARQAAALGLSWATAMADVHLVR